MTKSLIGAAQLVIFIYTFSASNVTTGEFDHNITSPWARTISEGAYTAGKMEINLRGYCFHLEIGALDQK